MDSPKDNDELREAILKQGTVKKAKITFSQKMYSNNTASPIEMSNQDIVEIGIDDLMHLISTHVVRARVDELQGIRSSVHYSDVLKHGGAHNKGFNRAVRWFHQNIDDRLAHLKSQRKEEE